MTSYLIIAFLLSVYIALMLNFSKCKWIIAFIMLEKRGNWEKCANRENDLNKDSDFKALLVHIHRRTHTDGTINFINISQLYSYIVNNKYINISSPYSINHFAAFSRCHIINFFVVAVAAAVVVVVVVVLLSNVYFIYLLTCNVPLRQINYISIYLSV